MNIRAVIHKAEEGGFWAEVPALPGCVTQGETMEEFARGSAGGGGGVARVMKIAELREKDL